MKSLNEWIKEMMTWGTPACGLFCGVCGVILAILLLSIGFWKTLFVAALCLVGAFLGGVKNKGDFIKNAINRLFPPKGE